MPNLEELLSIMKPRNSMVLIRRKFLPTVSENGLLLAEYLTLEDGQFKGTRESIVSIEAEVVAVGPGEPLEKFDYRRETIQVKPGDRVIVHPSYDNAVQLSKEYSLVDVTCIEAVIESA